MHSNREILERRIERTLIERIMPAEASVVSPLHLRWWKVPAEAETGAIGEPIPFAHVPFDQFTDFTVGTPWGAPWQTTWFLATADIPAASDLELVDGDRLEARINLGWEDHSAGFQCEAMVRTGDGTAIKALNPRNQWVPLPQPGTEATRYEFSLEAAANPLLLGVPPFQPSLDGDKLTSSHEDLYTFTEANVVILHSQVRGLIYDIAILRELVAATPELTNREWEVLLALSAAIDALDLDNVPATAKAAREVLAPFLAKPALPGEHNMSAVGHAHIDSGWLWPIRETRRKVARTLANVCRLIEDGSPLIFALPAAQHLEWVREDDPELFERVRTHGAAGKIVPVGGMWVEPDAVLPGGESMCRQLVEGQRFFEEVFGRRCTEVWLPDSFGYSAALPQIAREAGIHRFLTQKISWNQVDVFPHHTLLWEGIDGSRLFTHFPPADTYGSEVTGAQLRHAVTNFKEKGAANSSLLLFGYGDGGGGPTRDMMERLERVADLEGAPKVTLRSPDAFFTDAEAEYPQPPVWVGELYLELHRGTFTSQVAIKAGNRRSEALLREAEMWATTAAVRTPYTYPFDELRTAWRKALLCQFHDILPGTSIPWVYREALQMHAEIAEVCERIIKESTTALAAGEAGVVAAGGELPARANATSFPIDGVPAFGAAATAAGSASAATPAAAAPAPTADPATRTLSNGVVTLIADETGHIVSLTDAHGTEYIPAGQRAGEFHLFQDFPNMWDAWDIDPFYRGSLTVADGGTIEDISADDKAARLAVRVPLTERSQARVVWELRAGSAAADVAVDVDWADQEKLLKFTFPTDIHTDCAQYETQLGHITRPTHENTTWEALKFEVSCHRWLRVANATRALAISNSATYGWDVTRHGEGISTRRHGTWSLVRATLVKSARYPDPYQDQGHHSWTFRLRPGATVAEAIADGQALAMPLRPVPAAITPLIDVDGAVVESIALAPDRSGDVVIRLYEGCGGPSHVRLTVPGLTRAEATDLLYEPCVSGGGSAPALAVDGDTVTLDLGPFQLATLRLGIEPAAFSATHSTPSTPSTQGGVQ